jgi:hypothetical protein
MGFTPASSFDARARSVNALTEELRHIRFPVPPSEKDGLFAAQDICDMAYPVCREMPTSARRDISGRIFAQ